MPAFKKFGPGDQIDNVLVLEPKYDLVSGSNGWRGSPEGSASLNLYGGARRSFDGVFKTIEYQSLNPIARQIGNPVRGYPLTASVNLVWLTDEPLDLSQRSSTRWGEEHFKTVERLYQDYAVRNTDYDTASYDYYCLYFHSGSQNIAVGSVYNDAITQAQPPTASFTLENWAKPHSTSSANSNFTLQAMNNAFWLGLTGSTGRIVLSSSVGIVSASVGMPIDRWSHVAVAFDHTTLSGTFYLNLSPVGFFTLPTAISGILTPRKAWTVGNQSQNVPADVEFTLTTSGSRNRSFHGLVGESRYYRTYRTHAEISGAYDRRLTGSELLGPTGYQQFNLGPLSRVYDFAMGSGTIDPARFAQGAVSRVGSLNKFSDRGGPVWLPSDNTSFRPNKSIAPTFVSGGNIPGFEVNLRRSDDVNRMLVVSVPSAFSGRQISPGSVRIVDASWSSPEYKFLRTIVDDGRGGLYISGSMTSASLADREEYAGVGWNKVGNVFYSEGLIVIRDPSLLDVGRTDGNSAHPDDTFQLTFRGTSMVPVKTLMCRIDRGEFNCSANRTFSREESDGQRVRTQSSGSLRVSTIGIYNKDRELVAVARLADPLRIRPRDRLNIKLRFDF